MTQPGSIGTLIAPGSGFGGQVKAIPSPRTWACIAYILGEMGGDRIISADEAELRRIRHDVG
ncbi:MAG: hypothetical protein KF678_14005 [Phycisphaeraceae bacterium]|nr:hypothetical protein [Phycisphaeraceae bacterium]